VRSRRPLEHSNVPDQSWASLATLLVAVVTLAGVLPAQAVEARSLAPRGGIWRSGGPDGGLIRSLAVAGSSGRTIYAGGRGAFRSNDGGGHWVRATEGLPSPTEDVLALAVAPDDPMLVVAGTYQGIYRSLDGAATWALVSGPFYTSSLAFDPVDHDVVYAGIPGNFAVSTDDGATWHIRGTLPGYFIDALAINPANTDVMYAGVSSGGVYKSVDAGETWAKSYSGLPDDVSDLALKPDDPSTIYAGSTDGLWKSQDAGATWFEASGDLFSHVEAVAIDPRDPDLVYAATDMIAMGAVWVSSNDGQTWNRIVAGLMDRNVWALAVDVGGGQLLAGTKSFGVFALKDGAPRWARSSRGMMATEVLAVATDPLDEARAFAGLSLGMSVTETGGGWWTRPSPAPDALEVTALAFSPVDPDVVFAGVGFNGSRRSTEGVFRSTDGGRTWSAAGNGLKDPSHYSVHVASLAVAPTEPDTIYASVGLTTDTGTFYEVFLTRDGGEHWTSVWAEELPHPDWPQEVVVDPTNANVAYATTYFDGVYKTSDGGRTWTSVGLGLGDEIQDIAISPTQPNILYLAEQDGVYKSIDGAASWTKANDGLSDYAVDWDVAVDPHDANIAYAVVDLFGVYQTVDGGSSWEPLGTGLEVLDVRTVTVSASGATVYVGTEGGGVFALG
jgi:photosystem II stability/assembly factor-like uncharacterized protein